MIEIDSMFSLPLMFTQHLYTIHLYFAVETYVRKAKNT